MASPAELAAAREELARVNQQHGFMRRGAAKGDTGDPKENGPNSAAPPADNLDHPGEVGGTTLGATPADPGPPRFLGVDIENKLAGLSGGAVFPIGDAAANKIVAILLKELRVNMAQSLATVARTHKQPINRDQLEIPFGDKA